MDKTLAAFVASATLVGLGLGFAVKAGYDERVKREAHNWNEYALISDITKKVYDVAGSADRIDLSTEQSRKLLSDLNIKRDLKDGQSVRLEPDMYGSPTQDFQKGRVTVILMDSPGMYGGQIDNVSEQDTMKYLAGHRTK